MKSILISIRPEWVEKILNGEKIIEIRKTAPKCDLPIDVYVYCTKDNRYLIDRQVVSNGEYEAITLGEMHDPNKTVNITPESECVLNGKVVAKFMLKSVEEIKFHLLTKTNGYGYKRIEPTFTTQTLSFKELKQSSCLTDDDLLDYLNDTDGYAWHISDLVIFDPPKQLSEFGLKRAPQSWQYLEEEK